MERRLRQGGSVDRIIWGRTQDQGTNVPRSP